MSDQYLKLPVKYPAEERKTTKAQRVQREIKSLCVLCVFVVNYSQQEVIYNVRALP